MYRFTLCGVEVKKFQKPKKNVRGAISALDVKISDFQLKLKNSKYRSSQTAIAEYSQIVGEIKFMYLSDLLTSDEYRKIVAGLTARGVDKDPKNKEA